MAVASEVFQSSWSFSLYSVFQPCINDRRVAEKEKMTFAKQRHCLWVWKQSPLKNKQNSLKLIRTSRHQRADLGNTSKRFCHFKIVIPLISTWNNCNQPTIYCGARGRGQREQTKPTMLRPLPTRRLDDHGAAAERCINYHFIDTVNLF